MQYVIDEAPSSLIQSIEYDDESEELTLYFRKYYTDSLTYVRVPMYIFNTLSEIKSLGKFYLSKIKPIYSQKTQIMADKIIKCKIDVTKINKGFLFSGTKGTYLNFTVLYNEDQDDYGNNGMIIQDLPTEIYKKEKTMPADKKTKTEILGNCKVFAKESNEENKVGVESGTMGVSKDVEDDLPF